MGSVTTADSCPDLGGQGRVDASHASGASLTLCTHGGQLVSWKTASGDEMIYVSPTAVYGPPKAIRGGVPICFPQFGKLGSIPGQHGFARNSPWKLVGSSVEESATSVTMQLTKETLRTAEEESICVEWPHDFTLRITYSINASSLKVTAEVRAPTEDIEMALLFHTYLRVGDIRGTEIVGLQGLNYRPHAPDHAAEGLKAGETCFEQRAVVTIAGATDRVYLDHAAGRLLEVIDTAESRKITVSNSNLPDCTVWNPWVEGARDFGDMPDDGYEQFVCVENGQTGQIAIPKGGMWTSSVTLTAGGLTPGDARL